MKVSEILPDGKRAMTEIKPGAWAIILTEQEDIGEPDDPDTGYKYRPCDTVIEILGTWQDRCVLRESVGTGCKAQRVLYWSPEPFAIVEQWESPFDGAWAHLASEVGEHGLTRRLPKFEQPSYVSSWAGKFGQEDRLGKWTRLSDLAKLIRVSPAELLTRHRHHFDGIRSGIAMIRAEDRETVMATERYELFSTGNNDTFQELLSSDLSEIWVRRWFSLVALYLHKIGYPFSHTRA